MEQDVVSIRDFIIPKIPNTWQLRNLDFAVLAPMETDLAVVVDAEPESTTNACVIGS